MNKLTNPRAIACHIIHQIAQNKTSLIHLESFLPSYDLSEQNRRLVYVLCYGVFRHFFYLNNLLSEHEKGKTKAKPRILALVGLYQVLFMKKPIHAVINETVNACRELKLSNAKSFINGLLRQIDKQQSLAQANDFQELPDWLYGKLKKHYPNDIQSIIRNSNTQAPLFLRLNQQKNQTELSLAFKQQNICYHTTDIPYCIRLNEAQSITELPFFTEGFFSVQDASAQLAAHILQPKPQEKILDACAAPGGKSTHLLETCPKIELTIMDNNPKRFERIKENLTRLQQDKLNIHLLIQDAAEKLESNTQFDKILLDAPCSATGVIRRNPDIKVLRTPEDVQSIVKLQRQILINLSEYLKPKGLMLYATCSILPEENEKQMAKFLQEHPQFKPLNIPLLDQNTKQNYGYQILPQAEGGDGFYYCLLHKNR